MKTEQQQALIEAIEWIVRQIVILNPGVDLVATEVIDDVKKAFDPTYETLRERRRYF